MRCIIFWPVLLLVGCAGASSPPTSAQPSEQPSEQPSFSAIVDELESDDFTLVMRASLTDSELSAFIRQIETCWNVPIGAPNPKELVVKIRIQVNRDRTVRSAVIVDSARMETDIYFRAMAVSAKRAVLNPHCSPLELPPEKYDAWKKFTLRFDPRHLLSR